MCSCSVEGDVLGEGSHLLLVQLDLLRGREFNLVEEESVRARPVVDAPQVLKHILVELDQGELSVDSEVEVIDGQVSEAAKTRLCHEVGHSEVELASEVVGGGAENDLNESLHVDQEREVGFLL